MFNLENFSLVRALIIFFATAVSDVVWVFYIRRTGEGRALQAAFFSSAIVILGAVAIVSYVDNTLYLIPAVFGAFVGTIITIKFDLGKKKRK